MASEIKIKLDTVEEFAGLFGIPTAGHPLISISRVEDLRKDMEEGALLRFGFYLITLKDGCKAYPQYGWRRYDFSKGFMSFFSPGQTLCLERPHASSQSHGWIIAIHPDFLNGETLGQKIGRYKFFSYAINEALHVSDEERQVMEQIAGNLYRESRNTLDKHSRHILISHIDLLLSYAERFYTRQFHTRFCVEHDAVARFEEALWKWFEAGCPAKVSVGSLAAELYMTPHYLSDMLRSLTGMNTRQHIHRFLTDRAKELLLTSSASVGEVAYRLGFEYPQHFVRLFKSLTGMTPTEYRSRN